MVDSESNNNWDWFMKKLHGVLGDERRLVFMSDRNRGIKESIAKVFPSSLHAYCLFHLKGNLRTCLAPTNVRYKESLIKIFDKCAYAPTIAKFDQNMTKLLKHGGAAVVHFFLELPNERWANAFFPGQRYGTMSSSLAECFNSWILKERELPVLDMVDRIRKKMMRLMCVRREKAMKWEQVLCPDRESKAYNLVKTWKVIPSSPDIFEVDTDPSVSVDIRSHTCSCCLWQLDGFPCCHAVCAIKYSGKDLNSFVDPYFHVESYRMVYSKPIYPIPSLWKGDAADTVTNILPPSKKPAGRPKKRRIPSIGETVRKMKCGRCGKMRNHNRLTCKEDLRTEF